MQVPRGKWKSAMIRGCAGNELNYRPKAIAVWIVPSGIEVIALSQATRRWNYHFIHSSMRAE